MNIGIIGLGLIGASLAKAWKEKGHTAFGYDINNKTMSFAKEQNILDYELCNNNYNKLDVLVIALYPRAFESALNNALPYLKEGTIVLDIGGIKKSVVAAMEKASIAYPNIKFVATHPMAGKESWGITHSCKKLFEGASILMTNVNANTKDIELIKSLFLEIGAINITKTSAKVHDEMIAYTSQLAHLISSSYIKSPLAARHDGYSAGSFCDLTRVAKLNADMWTELIIDNRENVIKELDVFISNVMSYRSALQNGDEQKLKELLKEGNDKKEEIERATKEWKRIRNENN